MVFKEVLHCWHVILCRWWRGWTTKEVYVTPWNFEGRLYNPLNYTNVQMSLNSFARLLSTLECHTGLITNVRAQVPLQDSMPDAFAKVGRGCRIGGKETHWWGSHGRRKRESGRMWEGVALTYRYCGDIYILWVCLVSLLDTMLPRPARSSRKVTIWFPDNSTLSLCF